MPAAKRKTKFKVNTTPKKEAFVTSLTRDGTLEACIFDLIDNSIDGAKNHILKQRNPETDAYGLPKSYDGFEVTLQVDKNGVVVHDNCGGIPRKQLENAALRFGERSSQMKGVGTFGVGLNRAIFRLGSRTTIDTDTGSDRSQVTIDTQDYIDLPDDDWNLDAISLPSTGSPETTVSIGSPDSSIGKIFADSEWRQGLKDQISERYFPVLLKKLTIKVNGETIPPKYVAIRKDGPYSVLTKTYETNDGVAVSLEAGQHEKYRFTAEPDHDLKQNKETASDFGWSIICNDRLIVMSNREQKTGWDSRWHPEFNGFVGYVKFVSDDPNKLPWNTLKTDVDEANQLYQDVLSDMRSFTRSWRQNAYDAKKARKAEKKLVTPAAKKDPKKKGATTENTPKESTKPVKRSSRPKSKLDHNHVTKLLPEDVDERFCKDKLLALVVEAKKLDLLETPYAGMALIRSLFEIATVIFLTNHERYDHLLQHCFAKIELGSAKKLTKAQKDNFDPRLEDILPFMSENKDIWNRAKANAMTRCVNTFAANKKTLNGALHNPYQTINGQVAMRIRDDALPALRALIEDEPPQEK